jgi:hypothetical protein
VAAMAALEERLGRSIDSGNASMLISPIARLHIGATESRRSDRRTVERRVAQCATASTVLDATELGVTKQLAMRPIACQFHERQLVCSDLTS